MQLNPPREPLGAKCEHLPQRSHFRGRGPGVSIHQILLVTDGEPLPEGVNTLAFPVAQVSNVASVARKTLQAKECRYW